MSTEKIRQKGRPGERKKQRNGEREIRGSGELRTGRMDR